MGDNPDLAPFGNGNQDVDMFRLDLPNPSLLYISIEYERGFGGVYGSGSDAHYLYPGVPLYITVYDQGGNYLSHANPDCDASGNHMSYAPSDYNGAVWWDNQIIGTGSDRYSPLLGLWAGTYYIGIRVSDSYSGVHEYHYTATITDNPPLPPSPPPPPPSSQPDLAVTQPTWNTTDGGVDFGYSITGADLATLGSRSLLVSGRQVRWQSGQDTPAYGPVNTGTAQNTYSVHVNPGDLTAPPQNAKYLLAVINPDKSITEADASNDTNNVKALPVIPAPQVQIFARHSDGSFVTDDTPLMMKEAFTIEVKVTNLDASPHSYHIQWQGVGTRVSGFTPDFLATPGTRYRTGFSELVCNFVH